MVNLNFKLTLLTIIISFIVLIQLKKINIDKEETVEHFGNPLKGIMKMGKALSSFFTNFIDMFMVFVDACINFFTSFVDIILVLVSALQWIGLIPDYLRWFWNNILNIIFDIFYLLIIWMNPITLIKSIIKTIILFVKICIGLIVDTVKNFLRIFLEKIEDMFRGGLWGLPEDPKYHIKHKTIFGKTGKMLARDPGGPYHHHNEHEGHEGYEGEKYRPMRCYKGFTANGYLNMISMIICPPLGVFMSFGLSGILKILICCGLSLLYYFPGLVYALLVTSHLGIGTEIKTDDCGSEVGGLFVEGCHRRKTPRMCNDATIPNKFDINGEPVKACYWEDKDENPETNRYGGKCIDRLFLEKSYQDVMSGKFDNNFDVYSQNDLSGYGRHDTPNINVGIEGNRLGRNRKDSNKYKLVGTDLSENGKPLKVFYDRVAGTDTKPYNEELQGEHYKQWTGKNKD